MRLAFDDRRFNVFMSDWYANAVHVFDSYGFYVG
jgi:hypothetical protein